MALTLDTRMREVSASNLGWHTAPPTEGFRRLLMPSRQLPGEYHDYAKTISFRILSNYHHLLFYGMEMEINVKKTK